ncbi:DUF1569 domain-containing protein [Aquimarina sp. RZ0]|uniref:DUF1569 domain-containing protein n=1 Tax=Aquimarina sp. RZ0 TaxID=2607730 RepID=UPI0011F3E59D|nr:DUF1569 domain-containing protein [Aquimarina sp. RZ0]KAA1247871.1 DUF1569 domain-containing protein [Aquimarina sp. RZ0]
MVIYGTAFYWAFEGFNVVMMEIMDSQLNDIAYLIQFRDRINTNVSRKSVAWHLDHSLKVINTISEVLISSDPERYQHRFNWIRFILFTLRYMPRGKGKSSVFVLPPDKIKTEDLLSQLEIARNHLDQLESLDKNSNFIHPLFGQLNKRQTRRFLKMHTIHHLGIVMDILKS